MSLYIRNNLFWAVAALFAAVAFISLVLTRMLVLLLPRLGVLDVPDKRRHIHTIPVPRGGGLAIILSFLFGVLGCGWLFSPDQADVILFRLLPLLILVPLGMIDDKWGIPARIKLVCQLVVSFSAWLCGVRLEYIFNYQCPVWMSIILTVIWITGIINAFNLIDGVDGLAGGIAMISSLSLGGILLLQNSFTGAVTMICLAASCLGFLRYNLHPAKIFMGDTGSMFLGYMLGTVGILTSTKIATIPAILIPVLTCGLPILDTLLAIWRRVTRKMLNLNDPTIGVMTADRYHIHHRLLNHFENNQPKTVTVMYILTVILCLVAVMCLYVPRNLPWLAFMLVVITFSLVIHRIAVIELWNSSQLFFGHFAMARTGIILNIVQPIFDMGVLFTAFYIVSGIRGMEILKAAHWMTPILLVMIISRNYRVFWNYPSSEEYFRLMFNLGTGFVLSWCYMALLGNMALDTVRLFYVYCITSSCILFERLGLHYIRMKLIRLHDNSDLLDEKEKPMTILLYGVCPAGRMFVNAIVNDSRRIGKERILGFIDRDRTFRHGYCYSIFVLGGLQDLTGIYAKEAFDKLVLCKKDLDGKELEAVKKFCCLHGVQLVEYICSEVPLSTI